MGDNDFNVEHPRVTTRQRAGTLGRAVEYDKEAFEKALDFLASNEVVK